MKHLSSAMVIVILALSSCSDKTPERDCGCDSKRYTALDNVRVSYAQGIISTFADDDRLVNTYSLCTPLDTLAESADRLKPDYMMSGKMRLPCAPEGDWLTLSQPLVEVTAIKKIQ